MAALPLPHPWYLHLPLPFPLMLVWKIFYYFIEHEVSLASLGWLIYFFFIVNWVLLWCLSAAWSLILVASFGSGVVNSFDSVVVSFDSVVVNVYSCLQYLDIVFVKREIIGQRTRRGKGQWGSWVVGSGVNQWGSWGVNLRISEG